MNVTVASVAQFSLDRDVAEFLEHMGITSAWFDVWNPTSTAWEMTKRTATFSVVSMPYVLCRVNGVRKCRDFAQSLELAVAAAAAAASGSSFAKTLNLKRQAERAVSPLRAKRVKPSSSPPLRSRSRPAASSRPVASSSSRVVPSSRPVAASSSRRSIAGSAASSDNDVECEDSDLEMTSFKIKHSNMTFPSDFFFCDVVRSLSLSASLAAARRKLPPDGRARKRPAVLGELLRTTVPPSTINYVENRLRQLKADMPAVYDDFMERKHTEEGLYSAYLAYCKELRQPATTTRAKASPKTSKRKKPQYLEISESEATSSARSSADADSDTDPIAAEIKSWEKRLQDDEPEPVLSPPVALDRLPTELDWDTVTARMTGHMETLFEIIKDPAAHEYCVQLCAAKRAARAKTANVTQLALAGDLPHGG